MASLRSSPAASLLPNGCQPSPRPMLGKKGGAWRARVPNRLDVQHDISRAHGAGILLRGWTASLATDLLSSTDCLLQTIPCPEPQGPGDSAVRSWRSWVAFRWTWTRRGSAASQYHRRASASAGSTRWNRTPLSGAPVATSVIGCGERQVTRLRDARDIPREREAATIQGALTVGRQPDVGALGLEDAGLEVVEGGLL